MDYFVLLKMVPDTVEELEVGPDGKSLDNDRVRLKLSDTDEHALEQALLLKESCGGTVTVVTLEAPEVDEALFTALAKGADRAVKLSTEQGDLGTAATARTFASFVAAGTGTIGRATLILAGSQANDDWEGELAPYVAEALRLPYLGVVSGVSFKDSGNEVLVLKEFSGGVRGEYELALPAVLGVQAAEKPPRYVPVAKVRAVTKSAEIETASVSALFQPRVLEVDRMYKSEVAGRVQMLQGSVEEIAGRLADLLAERGII